MQYCRARMVVLPGESCFSGEKTEKVSYRYSHRLEKGENRVCLTPESDAILVSMGHTLFVQRGAGGNAHYSDTEYCDAGAYIVESAEEVYTADIVMKATSVSLSEARLMHDKQVILSPLKLVDRVKMRLSR